jgi:hypothetical protein
MGPNTVSLWYRPTPAAERYRRQEVPIQEKEKIMKIVIWIFTIILAMLLGSCATVGQFKPASEGERVIGTVQTTFQARDSWLKKNETINMQAYIKLLEAAAQRYPGEIDVRDIVWATGRYLGGINVEVSATGKVISIETNER